MMNFIGDKTKLIMTIAVCAVLILSGLVPIIAENGSTVEKKINLENEGTPVIMGSPPEEYNIQWDSALPGIIKINGNVTTVFFSAGADATVSPTSKSITTGLTYGELPVPTRTGYTFNGWFTSTEYTTEVTENTIVEGNGNRTLYAKWIANEYTVTFNAMGGTVSPATKTVTYGSAYGELPVPEYTGHIFGGWFDENDNPISSASIVSTADNHTLHAVYTTNQYLVSFTTDGNGNVNIQNVTVDYGTAYTISGNTITIDGTTVTATPRNSNYMFDHWTPSTSGTVTGAMTFIANFNNGVPITFMAQSPGSVDVQTLYAPIGTQYAVADNTVTVVGHNAVTASLPDGFYMTGWSEPQGTGTITEAMTFTAQYEEIEIEQIVCRNNTVWVITEDGKLFGCGMNSSGQQGDGTSGYGNNVTKFTQRLNNETIANVYCSADTTWVVTTDGKLFGCGSNSRGQQGNNAKGTDVTTFTQCLNNETIASVSCSGATTWVVTTDGKLFGCGINQYGQQGDGTSGTGTDVTTFTQRLSNETVASVSCSYYDTTWVVTTDGKLFGCGKNNYGQQGDGTTTNVTTFTQRLTNETIASVSCSTDTTWVITTDGKLFGCGRNSNGQQGDNSTYTDVGTFTQRLSTETIASVSCSTMTTWVVTTDGKLFGCGYNNNGQLGNNTPTSLNTFTQRLSNETIASVSCSDSTTWAVTTDGKLFGCGNNSAGQQGDGTTTKVTTFTQCLNDETITTAIANAGNTWALTVDGKIFGTGTNNNGQQGDGTTTNVLTFTQRLMPGSVRLAPPVTATFSAQSPGSVDTAQITDIPAGTHYTVTDNTITINGYPTITASLPDGYYMTGWNVPQGDGSITENTTFIAQYEIIKIAKVVCVNEVTWIITENGELFGCGNNAYGQQGNGTKGTGTNVVRFTQHLNEETVANVWCGNYNDNGNVTWAVTTDGKLFGCGANYAGNQSTGTTTDVTTFTQRLIGETVAQVSCTDGVTWVVTTDGKLFGCGSNNYGQQGNGTKGSAAYVTSFTQRLSGETVAKVVTGGSTTWAITTDGKLFGTGRNNYGQQGDGTTTDVTTFTQRLNNETIADVTTGKGGSTWVLTTDGKLFGCGRNYKGEQGDGTTTDVTSFTQRLSTETIASVSCDESVTWVVTTDGKLFGCGAGGSGQQDVASYTVNTIITTFTQHLSDKTIENVYCSNMTTWAITSDGELYGCGNTGAMGNATYHGLFAQRFDGTIIDVACSQTTTWIITNDGKLYGCGSNNKGQQGDGTTSAVTTFTLKNPPGMIRTTPQIQSSNNILNLNLQPRNIPLSAPTLRQTISITSTDYTWHAGGEDWMLCTVSVNTGYALALFYAGAANPLLWDEDTTLTYRNNTLSGENNGTQFSVNCGSIFYKGNGKYVLMDQSAYVKDDTDIVGYAIPAAGNGLMVKGTINNLTAENIGGDITVGDVSNTVSDTDYDDVYTLSEVSATYNTSQTATCTAVIVPNKVTVTAIVDDQTMDAMLSVIPLVMVVGLIVLTMGAIRYKEM